MHTDDLLRELICRLLCRPPEPHRPEIRFRLVVGSLSVTFNGDWIMLLPDDKTVSATVAFKDTKGKPAKVDGVPVWASDNEDAATVVAADDGMSAVVSPGALTSPEPWTANITVTADADLGEGVVPIIGTGSVTVTGGAASIIEVKFGTPQ